MLLIFLTCLSVAMATVSECPPEVASFDYETALNSADVVFVGTPTSGQSSIGTDDELREVTYTFSNIDVDEYFKDTTGRNANSVRILLTTTGTEPCQNAPTPGQISLIFARGSTILTIDSCNYGYPWECVPESARAILSGSK
uniref:Uncharacterized protein n=1 Tax=Arion vulgaris TaxID=1028688 RepID=A0A0B7A6R5_9EUPU